MIIVINPAKKEGAEGKAGWKVRVGKQDAYFSFLKCEGRKGEAIFYLRNVRKEEREKRHINY